MEAFNKILSNKKSQSLLPRGSIYYQLGDIYFKMNKFEKAIENYLLAIASDTAEVGKRRWIYPWSHYKVAQCYEILGDIEKAQYHYNEIEEEDSERAFELAEERADELLKDIDILLIKAKNLKGCHQYEQASVILNSIISKYASSEDEYIQENLREVNFRIAEITYEQKFYDEAINRFENIVLEEKEDRVEYWSYYYLGNIYKSKGNYEKAQDAYDKAEDTDDNWLLVNIEDERKELMGN
jgi:tetratricopeptide (TPR) repeat protein